METVPVIISEKNARLEFQGCSPDYIRNVCHGRCCWVTKPTGQIYTTVFVEKNQRLAIIKQNGSINEDGIIATGADGKCTFQEGDGLCKLHDLREADEPVKPRSCYISPWTLTAKKKLIIRNRYKLLGCYKAEPRLPAYRAFSSGLEVLFGKQEAQQIIEHFDAGGTDYGIDMDVENAELISGVVNRWNNERKEQRHDAAN